MIVAAGPTGRFMNPPIALYLWCVLGVVMSVALPILWASVRRSFPTPKAKAAFRAAGFYRQIKPYLILGLASSATALLLMIVFRESITDHKMAILAGYAWDSTLQRLR